MKCPLAKFLLLFGLIALLSAGCMTEPNGPVGDPSAQEQQSAGAVATVLSSIVNENGENMTSFTWNLFSDTFYQDGWWHTSFQFTLSNGDNGSLSVDANFQDAEGNNQYLPGALTTRMRTIVEFDGTFYTFPAKLNADVVLTRQPAGNVLNVSGAGTLLFDTMNLTFDVQSLVIDLDVLYPVGVVNAHMVDEHLGTWDIVIVFDGTNLVQISMNNGTSTFTFTLDLTTGSIT